jgi:hypothetical protein
VVVSAKSLGGRTDTPKHCSLFLSKIPKVGPLPSSSHASKTPCFFEESVKKIGTQQSELYWVLYLELIHANDCEKKNIEDET